MIFGLPVHDVMQCEHHIDAAKRSDPWLNSRRTVKMLRRGFSMDQCMRRAILQIGSQSLCKQHAFRAAKAGK